MCGGGGVGKFRVLKRCPENISKAGKYTPKIIISCQKVYIERKYQVICLAWKKKMKSHILIW